MALRHLTKYVLLVIAIGSANIFSSCSLSNRSVETRREFAIHFNQERLASTKNAIEAKWCLDIVSALTSTNPKAINVPRVASAILSGGKKGTFALFVFWIENYPSVDGLELRLSDQTSPVIIPIPEQELKQHRSQAKDTVVFGSEYDWGQTSELRTNLEQVVRTKDLKVRLLRAKAPVTDWHSVDFYKRGAWITGSKTHE